MIASLDGSLHPSRCTTSPDGSRAEWSEIYEEVHRAFKGDAWLVGRVTMAEMSKASPHAPTRCSPVERPCHFAARSDSRYAVALDPSGKLHFANAEINGDHVVVLLGRDVPDSHLAELAPAIEGRVGVQSFVEFGEHGLAGKVQFSLRSCEKLARGLVHLRYAVTPC